MSHAPHETLTATLHVTNEDRTGALGMEMS